MATRIRTLNFLPEIFKTPTNAQFLGATLDVLVDQPNNKKIQGYVGSKFGYGVNANDYYVTEPTKTRIDYQLDPGVVFTKMNTNTAQDFISYPGIVDGIKLEGGVTNNNNRLFESEFYSWDSFTNLDKLINFNQYYWIPEGPESVVVSAQTVFTNNDYVVTDVGNGYNIGAVGSAGSTTNPTLTLLRGGTYTFNVNQASGFWIQGAPGVTGFSPTQTNLYTRDVFGVENNGANQGVVSFTVPFKDAQDEYNLPGNNPVGVVSTIPFSSLNGQPVTGFAGIDGVTSLNGLTVLFYDTGITNEIGFVQNFYDYTEYDTNNELVATQTISITATNSIGNLITCSSTANLIVGGSITFTGTTPFGGIKQYSTTADDTLYYIESITDLTHFTISLSPNGSQVTLTTATGTMTAYTNQGLLEEGYYTYVNQNLYTINYVGTPGSYVINLVPASAIPSGQKIIANFGTQYANKSFFQNEAGEIQLIPYISATLDTLYYQDATSANKVGVIKIIESNITNTIDVNVDILGRKNYTSSSGVVFTNGLKITLQGDIYPTKYKTGQYYVEGVGTAIELISVEDLVVPEAFTESVYIPWDSLAYDVGSWEASSSIPVMQDYITIARNAINLNAWSRSNRWFHIDVINATATYNNNPNLVSLYATATSKAKRPIIEFYPNLKLFNSGTYGKAPIDFIDTRTPDAFSIVAGQQNYYPDVQVYTEYTGTIATTNYSTSRTITATAVTTNLVTVNSTTGFRVNDIIVIPAASTLGVLGNATEITTYYISEVVDGTHVKLSLTKNGEALSLTNASGSISSTWEPLSTTVTIAAADVTGTFDIGLYITDSTNVLPTNSIIESITGTTTLTIEVSWGQGTYGIIPSATNASLIATATTVDNYALFEGARVVFAADTNLEVRNKIYVTRFSTVTGSATPILTLTEATDGEILVNDQLAVYRGYEHAGFDFYFNGDNWIQGQQKIKVNQPPLFDVFDDNNISFGDKSVYVGSSFAGNKLFAYGIGSGINDIVLGFPIRYSSVNNVGDISFDVSLNADTFTYVQGQNPINQKVNTGYVYNYLTRDAFKRQLGWQTAVSPSVQYQLFSFDYIPGTSASFLCDIAANLVTEWPTVQVFVNNVLQTPDMYIATVGATNTLIYLNTAPTIETVIQVLILSDQVSPKAYYTIPINLNNNPLNEDLTTANVGEIRGQYQSMFYNNPNSTGEVFGSNNFRDLGNVVPWGNRIIQNSASLVLPGTFLRKQNHNLFNSLAYNSKEYIKFKTLLVDTVNKTSFNQRFDPSYILDNALVQIAANKSNNQPFFWSDMLPGKAAYIQNTYSFANSLDVSIYPLSKVYDFTKANYYGVLVYLNRTTDGIQTVTQLIKGKDYIVSTDAPSLTVTTDLAPGDQITIKEYNQTYGSYAPNTPTKLGLYPAFIPEVIEDTHYAEPTYFILGHDGSYNKLYGDYDPTIGVLVDFRDQALLEYETRVYNNLKLSNVIPIQAYEIEPGFFRNTPYTYDEYLDMYSPTFLNWVGQNRVEYKPQYFNKNNPFTYNYTNSGNRIDGAAIQQGYWRGVYQYFYDTTTPDSTPWEMLGYKIQPTWWATRYGPAPYTSDNLVLWGDLSEGIDWNNGNPFIIPEAVRGGLLGIIPVDSAGNLLSPFESIVGNYTNNTLQSDWVVGDDSPTELSYRRSSSWPFDLMRIMALSRPAKFFNLGVDVDNYKFSPEFNQYLVNNRSHLVINEIEIYGNGTPKTSYINWIVDFEKQIGIDATTNIKNLLNNLDVRLVYRLAGFSDKTLLKFYVEKGTPNSTSASLLIPDESYAVLLYDNQPFDKIVYSSIIVQQVDTGYAVFGNSQSNAYFKALTPQSNVNTDILTVEKITVRVSKNYDTPVNIVPYGTIFGTPQELANFIAGYGAYLRAAGMIFDDTQYGIEINWNQMISEFLYWAQTGWETGSIVTLNPSANSLTINKDSYIVEPLTLAQTNFVLNENLYPIQARDLNVFRDETLFNAKPLSQGDSIGYGQFNISNMEHGIVFDNTTLFNDTIYNLVTGLRQNRIYLTGSKTAEWNGTMTTGGFILNQDNILEWSRETKYTAGEIVKYKNKYWTSIRIVQAKEIFDELDWKLTSYDLIQKGLLPNPSTRAYESTLYYNVNKANLEQDADLLSFSLIGYRPRDYLAIADLTDITQVNVYKNLIKNKGTRNATNAFKGANLPQGGIDYDVYENWAILSGEFGGVLNNNFIEFKLNQNYLTGNPAIVGITDSLTNTYGVQQEVPLYSLFNYERPVDNVNILPTISASEPSTLYPDAGYVNFNDVKLSSYYYSQLPLATGQNGIVVPINQLYVRDYMWLADYLQSWQVYTPVSGGRVINAKNNLNNTVTITFAAPHNLTQYQPFAIVNFDASVNGYYLATLIVDQYNVIINLVLGQSVKNITGQGVAMLFQSQRVAQPSDINTLPLLDSEFIKNKVWVDTNNNGAWAVYRKSINYQYENAITELTAQTFGSAVAYTDDLGYLISDATAGKLYRYIFDALTKTYQLLQTITESGSFGAALTYSDNIIVAAEPTSASPKIYVYELIITKVLNTLSELQTISAKDGATSWGSSIAISGDKQWLYISATDLNRVYVYRKSQLTDLYEYATYVTTSGLVSGDQFGYSISTDYAGTTLVVGTPYQNAFGLENWGYTYTFNRIEQNILIQSNSRPNVPPALQLAYSPPTTPTTATDTLSGDYIKLSSISDIVVDNPIMFTGNGLAGTGVSPNVVYYVAAIDIPGTKIQIKASRTSASVISITPVASISVPTYVQTTPIYVSQNGTLVSDNNYAVVNSTLVFTGSLTAGDIINVSGQNFILTQTFTTEETPRVGVQFGNSVDITTSASEILVGAPFQLNKLNEEGAIHRFTNGGGKYGIILGTEKTNVTTDRLILLNGYLVNIPAGNATVAANAINGVGLINITASVTGVDSDKLAISVINPDLSIPNQKLMLVALDAATYTELGITVYTKTQVIHCPHLTGPTQFGYTIKFNEFDSFIASAPTGTRYEATTFDFSDDELDNDTVFDNNTTQWVDPKPNAGAVYMFDYLSNYNESLLNPGQFVFAQNVNNLDEEYGAQPRYGTALDFNNYNVVIGTPNFMPGSVDGQVVTFNNVLGQKDWSVFRSSSEIVDINKINNSQIFSAQTNNTLINLDYIDPLQGKILGAARENIDFVSNSDPAYYNNVNTVASQRSWGAEHLGMLWLDTSAMKFVNYHQDDVRYNSRYWGTLFPGSNIVVYSWISSPVLPIDYQGPGTPKNVDSYAIHYVLNSTGSLVPLYYYWVQNTNIIFTERGKTLSDSIVERYIANPQNSGISYFAPLLPNVFGIYNSGSYINAQDSVFHIGYASGTNDDISHSQYSLIRANYADDFLPGLPSSINRTQSTLHGNYQLANGGDPFNLYSRMLDSMCGVDTAGQVVPDPFLPRLVQYGVLARPKQSFFVNRFAALKNYLTYANEVLAQFPITETGRYSDLFQENPRIYAIDPDTDAEVIVSATSLIVGKQYVINTVGTTDFTLCGSLANSVGTAFIATAAGAGTGTCKVLIFDTGEQYSTPNYWSYANWWATGYSDSTKSSLQVPVYADLSTLAVTTGTIVTVAMNGNGNSETYIYEATGTWRRIGLSNGTIKFNTYLWDYSAARIGFGDNFFDTSPYDSFPSEETRWIIRALNEQIYQGELLIFRNKSLILLFEYIQSETIESENYLPWLNKTSFIDVSHTIRELKPIQVYQSDNQEFLAGYLNEVKPYHVVIKEFLFKYTGGDFFEGDITDFDLPAQFNTDVQQFVTPQLVYQDPNGYYEYAASDPIWQTQEYTQWFANKGLSLVGQSDYPITILASYITTNTQEFVVDNASGFPVNGTIKIGSSSGYEEINYSYVNTALNVVSGLQRGANGTTITDHIPGEQILIELPAIVLLNSGKDYIEPPRVVAYVDPNKTKSAEFTGLIDNVTLHITSLVTGSIVVGNYIAGDGILNDTQIIEQVDTGVYTVNLSQTVTNTSITQYIGPAVPAQLQAVMSLDSVLRIDVINPGQGYLSEPEIIIDSALSVVFDSSAVSIQSNTIRLYAPTLSTGDLIQYKVGANTTPPGGIVPNQWYYVNVLETSPLIVVALYTGYGDAVYDHNRVQIYNQGSGSQNSLNLGARAFALTSSSPTRENITTLRFDRNSYNSRVGDWIAGRYYGAYYAGKYSNSKAVASSSIQLESTEPPISSILAGAQGIAFEITDVRNERTVEYLSLIRNVSYTDATDFVRLLPSGPYVAQGRISSTTLTVNSVTGGSIRANDLLTGAAIQYGTTILNQITPLTTGETLGGVGRYTVSYSQTVPSLSTNPDITFTAITPNASGSTIGLYIGMPIKFIGAVGNSGITSGTVYYVASIINETDFQISISSTGSPVLNLSTQIISIAGLECYAGSVSDTAIITVNYPGITNVTATQAETNKLTIPLNTLGTGGTNGFYVGLPIFFTSGETDVFGGIVANDIYYVTTVCDLQTFTMSRSATPATYTIVSTDSSADTITLDDVISGLSLNDPIIFNNFTFTPGNLIVGNYYTIVTVGTTDFTALGALSNTVGTRFQASATGLVTAGSFVTGDVYTIVSVGSTNFTLIGAGSNSVGTVFVATGAGTGSGTASQGSGVVSTTTWSNIVAGTTYYISSFVGSTACQIATGINLAPISITDTITGTGMMTSQVDTYDLTTATGDMTININLPVSPGQVDNQKFTLYQTSGEYTGVTGTNDSLLQQKIDAVIGGTINIVAVPALTNFYIRMPVRVDTAIGNLTTATTYYVVGMGTVAIVCTSTSSSTNEIMCDTTSSLYVDMPIFFSGVGLGSIDIDLEYYVHTIVDSTHFKVTNTPGGVITTLQTSNGTMYGTGSPYVQLGSTATGAAIDPGYSQQSCTFSGNPSDAVITVSASPAIGSLIEFRKVTTTSVMPSGIAEHVPYYVLSTGYTSTSFKISATATGTPITISTAGSGSFIVLNITDINLDQYPTASPVFAISSILGGYSIVITTPGTGYAVDNTITILGTSIGGTTPTNDLVLTVNTIDQISTDPITLQLTSHGQITNVIANGTVPTESADYYLKVISPTEFALFSNSLMTTPVSGLTLPFTGLTSTTATQTVASSDRITVTSSDSFNDNDSVVFTGTVFGGIVLGLTYYIYDKPTSTTVRISTVPGELTSLVQLSDASGTMTMTTQGDYALLPEPFFFNQSIVKYNDQAYQCIVSNNDTDFVIGKWQLLDSGSRLMNALDRIKVYYAPTDDMPGIDITQLVEGVSYPNSIYLGNQFNPNEQFELDTILPTTDFYPTAVDLKAVVAVDGKYYAPADAGTYSGVALNDGTGDWGIDKLAGTVLNVSDIIYANGFYIVTTNNTATPIFRSANGISWSTNGYFTPFSSYPYDIIPYDMTALNVASLYLNSVGFRNITIDSLDVPTFIAVGQNIVRSTDTFGWDEVFKFTDLNLTNSLNGVNGITSDNFNGFIAVGKGQEFNYSTGVTIAVDVNLILTSLDGIAWSRLPSLTPRGFNAVTSSSSLIVAVGENGVIYKAQNGNDWYGINEVLVNGTLASGNLVNLSNTLGLTVGDVIRFTSNVGSLTTGTDYYVKTIVSSTQITVSLTSGGAAVTLTSSAPTVTTYLQLYPALDNLNDVLYANSLFMAVGDSGTIVTSIDGYIWTSRTSGTTENLNGVNYNSVGGNWIAVGENNTIIVSSNNGVTWTDLNAFTNETIAYTIQGDEFTAGFGPEELVPGVVTDSMMMTVATRPGTNWPATQYGHVGYNVVSEVFTPINNTQTTFSFNGLVQTPAQLMVATIDNTTGLSTTIYPTTGYTVNWIDFTVTLLSALTTSKKLRIDVYETGNGDQLVKASTLTDPIRMNDVTGWNEIYLNCNYTGTAFQGGGVVQPGTQPETAQVFATEAGTNTITCDTVKFFLANDPITFSGTTFGNIVEDTVYYVKTISPVSNTITISASYNIETGTAGPTFELTTATGFCYVIIQIGSGTTYTDPLVYHNGTKLLHGTIETVTRTNATRDTVTCNTTSGLIVNTPVVFSDTMFGGILLPQVVYYIKSIYDANEFTVSATSGGATIELADATGGASFITNDYAFAIQPNGIQASMVFAAQYDDTVDYLTYTVFGETAPEQYGYTIPETQTFIGDGVTTVFNLTNNITGDSEGDIIVEVNGLRQTPSTYVINGSTDTLTFTSAPTGTIVVTSYNLTQRQYFLTSTKTGVTVSNIASVSNAITPYSAVINITNTTTGTNLVTCSSTTGFSEGQTIQFAGTGFGNILTNGTVYFVLKTPTSTSSPTPAGTITISSTYNGAVFALTTASGLMLASIGGQPAVRVTTTSAHNLSTNNYVRIDGVGGSIQLNNQLFYVHVISPTQVDLYADPYYATLGYVNTPITSVSSYTASSGGYIWLESTFGIVTTTASATSLTNNSITVASTSNLVVNTPVYFTEGTKQLGDTTLGGLIVGERYYIKEILTVNSISVTDTYEGDALTLTTTSGSMNLTQWEQDNVDRLWVTVNGYRVPSTSLRLNPANQISILTTIATGDTVVITSMIPSATPNEEVYLLNVNQTNAAVVYRANTLTRTWLTQDLYNTSPVMYMDNVDRITNTIVQSVVAPVSIDGSKNIGLAVDKNLLSSVTVYNDTKAAYIASTNYKVIIEGLSPILQITDGAYISTGDQLTVTSIEGNILYLNGEQIIFTTIEPIIDATTIVPGQSYTIQTIGTTDFTTIGASSNTVGITFVATAIGTGTGTVIALDAVSGLVRGVNGTAVQTYTPQYSEVFGLLAENQLSAADYNKTWNPIPGIYNVTEGDPLQISETAAAIFLNQDI